MSTSISWYLSSNVTCFCGWISSILALLLTLPGNGRNGHDKTNSETNDVQNPPYTVDLQPRAGARFYFDQYGIDPSATAQQWTHVREADPPTRDDRDRGGRRAGRHGGSEDLSALYDPLFPFCTSNYTELNSPMPPRWVRT